MQSFHVLLARVDQQRERRVTEQREGLRWRHVPDLSFHRTVVPAFHGDSRRFGLSRSWRAVLANGEHGRGAGAGDAAWAHIGLVREGHRDVLATSRAHDLPPVLCGRRCHDGPVTHGEERSVVQSVVRRILDVGGMFAGGGSVRRATEAGPRGKAQCATTKRERCGQLEISSRVVDQWCW